MKKYYIEHQELNDTEYDEELDIWNFVIVHRYVVFDSETHYPQTAFASAWEAIDYCRKADPEHIY